MNARELLANPSAGDHIVESYHDDDALAKSVTAYLRSALERGEGAIVIATAAHRDAFALELRRSGVAVEQAIECGQMRMLDAAGTLAEFCYDGAPDRVEFERVIGAAIAELRARFPAVRAYGEMVDLLWQRGARDMAIRLEEFWNELARKQPFSLLCAYRMDALDPRGYAGDLQCVCGVHSHFLPGRDTGRLDDAVIGAAREVLDEELSRLLLALAERHPSATAMPAGQKALFWLQKNMPLTAEQVLAEVRARY